MQGTHLLADWRDCATSPTAPAMTDPAALRAACLQAVREAGLHAVGELFHAFAPPGGVTGVVLLAESHLALHTWPELSAVTLDVYVCNLNRANEDRAELLLALLRPLFKPGRAQQQRVLRGALARA